MKIPGQLSAEINKERLRLCPERARADKTRLLEGYGVVHGAHAPEMYGSPNTSRSRQLAGWMTPFPQELSSVQLEDCHSRSSEDCLSELEATPAGLSSGEASRRLAIQGPNSLPEFRARGPLVRLLAQFHNILIYVLLGRRRLRPRSDTGRYGVILAVVLGNAVIGFVQEGRAEHAMDAIRQMLSPRAAVLRDGGA